MKPLIPWPNPEGYSPRDKDWLIAVRTEEARAYKWRRRTAFLGFLIFMSLLWLSPLSGQHRTVLIETGDSSTILEIYQDHTFTEHFYIFDLDGAMTEVWVFDEEWLVVGPPPEASQIIPLLFQKDFLGHPSPLFEKLDNDAPDYFLDFRDSIEDPEK